MSFDTWVMFVLTETLMCFSPGPAVVLVVSQGLKSSARGTVPANLGVLSGNAVYFVLSAIGVGALILSSQTLFAGLKLAGACYLVWLGACLFFGQSRTLIVNPAGDDEIKRFRQGLLLQLSSPKSLFFFVAVLPVFIDPAAPLAIQVAILGVTSIVIEFLVLGLYGLGAGRARRMASNPRTLHRFERICGIWLVMLGISLAFWRRADG